MYYYICIKNSKNYIHIYIYVYVYVYAYVYVYVYTHTYMYTYTYTYGRMRKPKFAVSKYLLYVHRLNLHDQVWNILYTYILGKNKFSQE